MTHCSQCAAENLDDAKFCAECGRRLAPEAAPAAALAPEFPAMRGMMPTPAATAEEHHPAMRGMAPLAAIPGYAQSTSAGSPSLVLGAAALPAGTHFAVGKNPAAAVLLSAIFPGGGQLYNGDTKKGLSLLALAIVASCLTLYAGAWFLGVPLSLGSWVWSMLDASKVARREKAIW